jgi:hypothetical protein
MKPVRIAIFKGSWGEERAIVSLRTSGRFKGHYCNRGAGFAGRIAYRSVEVASAQMERHALFVRWEKVDGESM